MTNSIDNLYRIDDVLIKGGYWLLVLAVFVTYGMIMDKSIGLWPTAGLLAYGLLLLAPVLMLISGYKVRRQETRTVDLWRVLRAHRSMSIRELCETTGFSAAQLREAVNLLNRKVVAGLTVDEQAGVVRHSIDVPHSAVAHTQRCESCGASVVVSVGPNTRPEDLSCTYCQGALKSHAITELQLRLREPVGFASLDPAQYASLATPHRTKSFNLVWFILLMMFFWPAGIYYAVSRARNSPLRF